MHSKTHMQFPTQFLQMPPTNRGHGHRSEDHHYGGTHVFRRDRTSQLINCTRGTQDPAPIQQSLGK